MHGVVSLLDAEHSGRVEALWTELDKEFGVRGIYVTPFPHFSYQVAERYEVEALASSLQGIARDTSPFRVRTAGLGIFTGPEPVLYVPVVRNSELSAFHGRVSREASRAASGALDYYAPHNWMPHITLAQSDVDGDVLSRVVRAASGRNLAWEIRIDNLSLIYDTGSGQEVRLHFEFGCRD
jgi:2'-5' RNA ligase